MSKSAKVKAAEARNKEAAAQKKRQRFINLSIFATVTLVVVGIVGGAFVTSQSNKVADQPNPKAAAPVGTIPAGEKYEYGVKKNDAPDAPVLEIWEDFQCPACGTFESQFGATINDIAEKNLAQVILRSTSFLDTRFPGQNSQRAAGAWGCAIDQGRGNAFHDAAYSNQPFSEGDGYSKEQLLDIGRQAGITGTQYDEFEQCVVDKKYLAWAANGTATMIAEGVTGTPTLILDGEALTDEQRATPETLLEAVKAANPQE